jgi:SAM-dependent methyltransferase
MSTASDARQFSPSTARNRGPILDVLKRVLPQKGLIFEIASGTGEHAIHFARSLPEVTWQPSDPDSGARASIAAWIAAEKLPNVRAPLAFDVTSTPWPVERADAVLCINMIHISPWSAAEALLRGAARILPPGGVLFLYGPYKRDGRHTAPSNEAFDQDLRRRNPAWGVRDLADVEKTASAGGLRLSQIVEMPANNLSVVFVR